MRAYSLPDGTAIDLDQVLSVDSIFINKNYSQYNCYEIRMLNGDSFGIFENELPRSTFITTWSA